MPKIYVCFFSVNIQKIRLYIFYYFGIAVGDGIFFKFSKRYFFKTFYLSLGTSLVGNEIFKIYFLQRVDNLTKPFKQEPTWMTHQIILHMTTFIAILHSNINILYNNNILTIS